RLLIAFSASCTAPCTMASVRVDWTAFWPFASITFMVVSFHWTTALAAGWARAGLERTVITETRTAIARIRAPCLMGGPPLRTGELTALTARALTDSWPPNRAQRRPGTRRPPRM